MGCCGSKDHTAGDAKAGQPNAANKRNNNAMKPAGPTAAAGAKQPPPPAPPAQSQAAAEEQARLAERDRLEQQRRQQEREALKAKGGFISYKEDEHGSSVAANADKPAVEVQVAKPPPPDPAVARAAAAAAASASEALRVEVTESTAATPQFMGGQGKKRGDDNNAAFSDYSDADEGDGDKAFVAAAAHRAPPPPPSPPAALQPRPDRSSDKDSDSDSVAYAVEEDAEDEDGKDKGSERAGPESPHTGNGTAARPSEVTPEKTILRVAEGQDDDLRGPSTARVEEVPLHLAKPTSSDAAYGRDLDEDSEVRPVSPHQSTKAFRRPAPPTPPPPPPLHEETATVEEDVVEEADGKDDALVPHDPADEVDEKPKEEENVVVHPDGSATVTHKTTETVPAGGGYTVQRERIEIVDTDEQGRPIGTRHVENTIMTASSGGVGEAVGKEPHHPHPLKVEESSSPLADILAQERDGKQQGMAPLVEEPTGDEEDKGDVKDADEEDEANGNDNVDVEDVEMNIELTRTSEMEEGEQRGKAEGEISLTSTSSPVDDNDGDGFRDDDANVPPPPAAANKYLDSNAMKDSSDEEPQPVMVSRVVGQERQQGGALADLGGADSSEDEMHVPMPKAMSAAPAPPLPNTSNPDVLDDLLGAAAGGIPPPPMPSPGSGGDSAKPLATTTTAIDDLFANDSTSAAPAQDGDARRVLDSALSDAAREEEAAKGEQTTPPPRRAPPAPIMSPPPPPTSDDVDNGSLQT